MADMTSDQIISALRSMPFGVGATAADLIIAQAAEIARLNLRNDQLEQDLSDMRDNADSAYRRGYWAGGNGA